MQQLHGYTTKITSQQATQKRKFRRLFLLVWSSDLLPGLHNSQEKTQNCRSTKFKLAPFSTSKTLVLTGQIRIDTGFSEVRNTMRHRENPVCFSKDWLANGEHPSVVFLPNEAPRKLEACNESVCSIPISWLDIFSLDCMKRVHTTSSPSKCRTGGWDPNWRLLVYHLYTTGPSSIRKDLEHNLQRSEIFDKFARLLCKWQIQAAKTSRCMMICWLPRQSCVKCFFHESDLQLSKCFGSVFQNFLQLFLFNKWKISWPTMPGAWSAAAKKKDQVELLWPDTLLSTNTKLDEKNSDNKN